MKKHRNMIVIISFVFLLIVVAFGIKFVKYDLWSSDIERTPYDLVMTLKEDATTSIALTWNTEIRVDHGVVQIAPGSEEAAFNSKEVQTIEAVTTQINIGEADNSPSYHNVHKADITGLSPGTSYIYRVGDGTQEGWSRARTFQTAEENTDSFSWIHVADTQGTTNEDFQYWGRALRAAFKLFPDAKLIVHNGDLTEDSTDDGGWQNFFTAGLPWITQVPLLPVTGNHDEVDGNADLFVSHFNLPSNGASKSTVGTNYTVDYGNVHFVFLNTESHIKAQSEWLEKDLASNTKEWTIVAIHRPAYGGNSYKKIADWITVFDKYGVDLVLQGHNHEYSRSYPLRDGKVVKQGQGTIYVTPNTTGPKFNEKKDDQFYHEVHFQNYKGMFAGVTVSDNKLTYQAFDVDGNKLDEFVIQH